METDGGVVSAVPTPSTVAVVSSPQSRPHSTSIGQFFKKIRSRSKSPAPPKKSLENQAWVTKQIEYTEPVNLADKHYTNSGHVQSPKQSQRYAQDVTSLPSHSPSRKNMKSYSIKESPSQDDTDHKTSAKGGFGSWIQSRFGRSPSGKKPLSAAYPHGGSAQSALRDQDKRGALSEEDLVSKSLASEIASGMEAVAPTAADRDSPKLQSVSAASVGLASYHSQDSIFNTQPRLPSYVGISCTLSGYRNYRPALPASPLSQNGGSSSRAHHQLCRDNDTQKATPQGKSIVERRLEKFQLSSSSKPQTGPPSRLLDNKIQPVFAAEQQPTPVRELVGNFGQFDEELPVKSEETGGCEEDAVFAAEQTPTPVGELVGSFNQLSLRDDGTPATTKANFYNNSDSSNRPKFEPPPIPAKRKSKDRGADDSAVSGATQNAVSKSSVDTEAYATGPTSTTQDDEGSSLLEEVMKATEHMMLAEENLDSKISYEVIENETEGIVHVGNSSVGKKYQELAFNERRRLEESCAECERDLETVSSEQVAAYLRMAVGKCKLLLGKKFAKFEELVEKNLNPMANDPCPARDDDLEAYWLVVMMEVEDVNCCLKEVSLLRAKQWILGSTIDDADDGARKTKARGRSSGRNSPTNGRQNLSNGQHSLALEQKGREEARERIKAAKVAAMQKKAANDDETQIFIS